MGTRSIRKAAAGQIRTVIIYGGLLISVAAACLNLVATIDLAELGVWAFIATDSGSLDMSRHVEHLYSGNHLSYRVDAAEFSIIGLRHSASLHVATVFKGWIAES